MLLLSAYLLLFSLLLGLGTLIFALLKQEIKVMRVSFLSLFISFLITYFCYFLFDVNQWYDLNASNTIVFLPRTGLQVLLLVIEAILGIISGFGIFWLGNREFMPQLIVKSLLVFSAISLFVLVTTAWTNRPKNDGKIKFIDNSFVEVKE